MIIKKVISKKININKSIKEKPYKNISYKVNLQSDLEENVYISVKEVTDEYIKNYTEGLYIADGIKKHKEEKEVAKKIIHMFGGKIELLKEGKINGILNPDYEWNGKLWELKTISTEKAVDSALRKGFKQVMTNKGGVIIKYPKGINKEELDFFVKDRFRRLRTNELDIMYISDDIKIYRYKNKKG